MTYRVIITGSREWSDKDKVCADILALLDIHGDDLVIVHGKCPTGADKIAEEFCDELNITQEKYPANWNRYGNAAGPIRNRKMVSLGADVVLAYPLGKSSGTRGCMELAEAAGIEVLDRSAQPC